MQTGQPPPLHRLLTPLTPACNPVAQSTSSFTGTSQHHQRGGAVVLSIASYRLSAPWSGSHGRWCRGSRNRAHRVQTRFCVRRASATVAERHPSHTTPCCAGEKWAEMPIYSLTPMCQLLSLHKHQDSGRIISRLPPQAGAELRETDDSVMLSDACSKHTHTAPGKKASFQWKAHPGHQGEP